MRAKNQMIGLKSKINDLNQDFDGFSLRIEELDRFDDAHDCS